MRSVTKPTAVSLSFIDRTPFFLSFRLLIVELMTSDQLSTLTPTKDHFTVKIIIQDGAPTKKLLASSFETYLTDHKSSSQTLF